MPPAPFVLTRGAAAATPSSRCTSSTAPSGRDRRWLPVTDPVVTTSPWTRASISEAASRKRSSATWSRVVDRMKVPAMNPTPRTMASTVDSSLRLWAHRDRKVTRRMRAT